MPGDFPTIGRALSAANPGNVVMIGAGTYREQIVLAKAVSLIGAGRDQVIVEASPSTSALQVIARDPSVVVRGITFRHSREVQPERRVYLVSLQNSRITFEQNRLADAYGTGLLIQGGTPSVLSNDVVGADLTGIDVTEKGGGKIQDNTIRGSGALGLSLFDPGQLAVLNNTISENRRNGIWVATGDDVLLANNRVEGNGTEGNRFGGIGVGAGRVELRENTAKDNIGTGIWWASEASPVIGVGNVSDGNVLPVSR